MDSWIKLSLTIIGIIIAGTVAYFTIYYNFTPQIVWQTQSVSAGSNTPNACTIQAYASACPYSLVSNNASFVYLENIGDVPAYFFINFSSNSSNSVKIAYYTKSSVFKGGQTSYFGFIPTFSNVSGNFSIQVNATCSPEALFCRGYSKISVVCNYTTLSNSQTATLRPQSVG